MSQSREVKAEKCVWDLKVKAQRYDILLKKTSEYTFGPLSKNILSWGKKIYIKNNAAAQTKTNIVSFSVITDLSARSKEEA